MTYFLGIISIIKTILFLQINSVLFSVKYQKRVKVFSLLPASCLNLLLKGFYFISSVSSTFLEMALYVNHFSFYWLSET